MGCEQGHTADRRKKTRTESGWHCSAWWLDSAQQSLMHTVTCDRRCEWITNASCSSGEHMVQANPRAFWSERLAHVSFLKVWFSPFAFAVIVCWGTKSLWDRTTSLIYHIIRFPGLLKTCWKCRLRLHTRLKICFPVSICLGMKSVFSVSVPNRG